MAFTNPSLPPIERPKPTCKHCHQPYITRYFRDCFSLLSVGGWCDCTRGHEDRYLFDEMKEVYGSEVREEAPPAESIDWDADMGLPILPSRRLFAFWTGATCLFPQKDKRPTYNEIEEMWKTQHALHRMIMAREVIRHFEETPQQERVE